MTRVLLAVGGFVLVIVAAIVRYLMFADLGRFRPEVEAAVSNALGREFRKEAPRAAGQIQHQGLVLHPVQGALEGTPVVTVLDAPFQGMKALAIVRGNAGIGIVFRGEGPFATLSPPLQSPVEALE